MNKKVLVVKVGTSTLLGDNEEPSSVFASIAQDIKKLRNTYNIALVSSGAIGFGVRMLKKTQRPSLSEELQALSCIGQPKLMAHWQKALGDIVVGQALTTNHELEDKSEEKKLLTATKALWNFGVIPVFNENDALADEEIKVGDNDTLAAHIALHLHADALLLLSDVDGVYKNFGSSNQEFLKKVSIEDAKKYSKTAVSSHGTGGLQTKIRAAEIVNKYQIPTYLVSARETEAASRALKGEIGTKFVVK